MRAVVILKAQTCLKNQHIIPHQLLSHNRPSLLTNWGGLKTAYSIVTLEFSFEYSICQLFRCSKTN